MPSTRLRHPPALYLSYYQLPLPLPCLALHRLPRSTDNRSLHQESFGNEVPRIHLDRVQPLPTVQDSLSESFCIDFLPEVATSPALFGGQRAVGVSSKSTRSKRTTRSPRSPKNARKARCAANNEDSRCSERKQVETAEDVERGEEQLEGTVEFEVELYEALMVEVRRNLVTGVWRGLSSSSRWRAT